MLHKIAIMRDGGDPGLLNEGLVHLAAEQPHQTFGGADLYPTLVDKAAATAFALTANHAFSDGNKRTGLLTLDYALQKHGYELVADATETYVVFRDVAEGTKDREYFVRWVENHIRPIDSERLDHLNLRLPHWGFE